MHLDNIIIQLTAESTAQHTIKELRRLGMLKHVGDTVYQRTECILQNYDEFKTAVRNDKEGIRTSSTRNYLILIDKAIDSLKEDPYFDIIRLHYMEKKSYTEIADALLCDEKVISRNKKRLLNTLAVKLFSDNFIQEVVNS